MQSTSNGGEEHLVWKTEAEKEQRRIAEMLGNAIDKCTYDILKTRVAISLYGVPQIDEGNVVELSFTLYKEKEQKHAEEIVKCILQNQITHNPNSIYVGFTLVFVRTLDKNPINFQQCVFRIPATSKGKYTFIDSSCRVYEDWESFLKENTFPQATICYPENGIYDGCKVPINFCETPSAGIKHRILFGGDIATAITGTVASCVVGLSLLVPIITPVVGTALGIAVTSQAYGMGRCIESLVDRGKHGQTLSLMHTESRRAWLGATLPIFGIAAQGGTVLISSAGRLGISLNSATKVALNVTNGMHCAAQALFLGSDVCGIVQRKIKENEVTAKDILQCIASALLFANAVVSTHQARMILKSMPSNDFLPNLSQPVNVENGLDTRPTNTNVNSLLIHSLSVFGIMQKGAMILNISNPLWDKVQEIIKYIQKSINDDTHTDTMFENLLLHAHQFWELLQKQIAEPGSFQLPFSYPFSKEENSQMGNRGSKRYDAHNTHFENFEKRHFMKENVIKEVAAKEREFQNKFNDSSKEDEEKLESCFEISVNRMNYFIDEILGSYKDNGHDHFHQRYLEFCKKNIIYIPLFLNHEKLKIMYFSWSITETINYHILISNIVKSNSFVLIENEQYCEVLFESSQLEYSTAYIIICQSNRGLVILKQR